MSGVGNLPTDVLGLIAKKLNDKDLINWARTSKGDRSSKFARDALTSRRNASLQEITEQATALRQKIENIKRIRPNDGQEWAQTIPLALYLLPRYRRMFAYVPAGQFLELLTAVGYVLGYFKQYSAQNNIGMGDLSQILGELRAEYAVCQEKFKPQSKGGGCAIS